MKTGLRNFSGAGVSECLIRICLVVLAIGNAVSLPARSKRELLEERSRISDMMEIVSYKRIQGVRLKDKQSPEASASEGTLVTVDLRLSILRPDNWSTEDERPAVLFFHGGGFHSGSPAQFFVQAELFAAQGAVSFCVEYRLKDNVEVTIAEQLEDARTAVRWVRANANSLGVDPNQVIAAGGSAGGYLAIASAVLSEDSDESGDAKERLSSVPNAIVAYNPALEFEYYAKRSGRERIRKSVGGPLDKYSCIENIKQGLPPIIIFQGTDDGKTPLRYASRFAEKSRLLGNTCELVEFKRLGHGFHNRDPYIKRCVKKARRFLKAYGFKLD